MEKYFRIYGAFNKFDIEVFIKTKNGVEIYNLNDLNEDTTDILIDLLFALNFRNDTENFDDDEIE